MWWQHLVQYFSCWAAASQLTVPHGVARLAALHILKLLVNLNFFIQLIFCFLTDPFGLLGHDSEVT